ncbi:hypothetical protein D9M68_941320 [compost metagenome]
MGKLTALDPQFQFEVLAQHLNQRGIEARLIFVDGQREPGPDALAVQRHGQEDKWRPEGFLVFLVAGPGEKTQREKQGVRATFLQRCPCRSVQVNQTGFELLLG